MSVGQEERERQLGKDIGERLNPEDEQVKARMKDLYQQQFTKAINDAKAAHQRGDSSKAMWHETLTSEVHNIIKLLE